jgi:hypothetical protein
VGTSTRTHTESRYEHDDEGGREALLLGRGDFGSRLEGVLGTDGRLRCVTNRVDGVDVRWLQFGFDAPHRRGPCAPSEGNAHSAPSV